jgi:hypothetical protein
MKYLGVEPEPDDDHITFNWWEWGPGNTSLDEDREKYVRMSNREVDDVALVVVGEHSPIELISVGPFLALQPNSTIQIDFAFVCARTYEDIRENGRWAQEAYDHDYILPEPPPHRGWWSSLGRIAWTSGGTVRRNLPWIPLTGGRTSKGIGST